MISVIMGIYNNESTLKEAMDSIVGQTYTDWELIMCDDGSVDNTYEIAKEFIKLHPDNKFKLIKHTKNMGLNQTLNDCLKEAEGEYIARMDGDDISLPNRFEEEIKFLDSNPQYALVSCPMIYFDDQGVFRVGRGGYEPLAKNFIKGTPFCHAPCMIRTQVIKEIGGYSISKKLLRVEDYHLWYKMYMAGYKGYNLSESLYKMRDDRNAISRRKYRFRINEAYVKYLIYKDMKPPKTYIIYILKPLLVGLLPTPIYKILHKNRR